MAVRQTAILMVIFINAVCGLTNRRVSDINRRDVLGNSSGRFELGQFDDDNESAKRSQLKVSTLRGVQSTVKIPTRIYSDSLKIFLKSGPAVKYTTRSPPALVLTSSASEAAQFLLVPCLALAKVDQSLRHQCFSLMAAKRQNWYIRQYNFFLSLESMTNPRRPDTFDLDSSFVIHEDQFYQNFFAFDSVRFPGLFIASADSGKLKITEQEDTAKYFESASFAISGPDNGWVFLPSLGKYYRVIFEMMDWYSADERCRALGTKSHLIVVNDTTENTAIKDFLRSFDPRLKRSCNKIAAIAKQPWLGGYWTSGRRETFNCGNTPWVWNPFPDVVYRMTFTDFPPSEPNCATVVKPGEHFIHYGTDTLYNFRWNDLDGDLPMCALCELD